MKTITRFIHILLFGCFLFIGGCEQEVIELTPAPTDETNLNAGECPPGASAGNADFSKFIAIGNSLTAGFQAGALFTEAQQNSLGAVLARSFACVGGGEFNQPDINSVNGYNASLSNPVNGIIRGRLVLFDADGPGPGSAIPVPAGTPGLPAPYNSADLPAPYTGDKSKLNNFAVPGILLGQVLTPDTGNPNSGAAYNPLYARFASNPGTSTILQDAIAANGTFFLFWLGNNDLLGYAVSGATGDVPMTDATLFANLYEQAIDALLNSNPNLKGVIANIPDVSTIPYFTTVPYNAIPLDQATADQLNAAFQGYNAILDALKAPPFNLPANAMDYRKISFAPGNNSIVIEDETLDNLGAYFDAIVTDPVQRAMLAPYEQVRQARDWDLITLPAGSILGTTVGDNPQAIHGITVPLSDRYVLLPQEVNDIRLRMSQYNSFLEYLAGKHENRIALADIYSALNELLQKKVDVIDGVTITPNIAPPTGIFSEDGIHPNSRGIAYTANVFIKAINARFGSTIPLVNLSQYKGTGLPVTP